MGVKVLDDGYKWLKKLCGNDDTCVLLVLVAIGFLVCMLFQRDGFMGGAPLNWSDHLSELVGGHNKGLMDHGDHGDHGEQVQLGATASDCLLPRGLTASTGKRPKPVGADDDDDEHLDPEVGGERRRRRGPTTLVFQGEQA